MISDLHLECDPDVQKQFIRSLDPADVDVLVLAGDICEFKQSIESISLLCKRFEDSYVLWVHGNHEYHGTTRSLMQRRTQEALRQNKNLRWLEMVPVHIEGQRFLGSTMWFKWNPTMSMLETQSADFSAISGLHEWVYDANSEFQTVIDVELQQSDIVVTHHAPSYRSIAPRFIADERTQLYVCDMESIIVERQPKLWIHGHTHDSFDYMLEKTRVVCNPRGYHPDELNPEFRPDLIIKV